MNITNMLDLILGLTTNNRTIKETIHMFFCSCEYQIDQVDTLNNYQRLLLFCANNISLNTRFVYLSKSNQYYIRYYADNFSKHIEKYGHNNDDSFARHLMSRSARSTNLASARYSLAYILDNWTYLFSNPLVYHFLAYWISKLEFKTNPKTKLELIYILSVFLLKKKQ